MVCFQFTVTTAKSITDEEQQNQSAIILSARPGNGENGIERTVNLSNTAIAVLPEGMKQPSFRVSVKRNTNTAANLGIIYRCRG